MKKRFTILIAAIAAILMMTQPGKVMGQTKGSPVTYTFSEHYNSNTVLDGTPITLGDNITALFNKRNGGTATQYYTFGYAVRWYGGGTLKIDASGNSSITTITEINITYTQTANSVSASVGNYSLNNSVGTWTKPQNSNVTEVTFTQSGTSGHCKISEIQVSYTAGGGGGGTTYTVTFDDGDGTFVPNTPFPNATTTIAGGTYLLPKATPPAGYTFNGWKSSLDNKTYVGNYTVTAIVAFTAQYAEIGTQVYSFAGANNFYTDDDLTTHPDTGSSNNVGTIYYVDGSTFVASGSSRYFSAASSGYFMLGTTNATLSLPTFSGYKITQVKIHSSSTCSTAVQVSIVSGSNTAATSQTWSSTNTDYTYSIGTTYQTSPLSVKVGNNKNAQITSITLTCVAVTPEISVTPTSLSGFTYSHGHGPSAAQSFAVSGSNLTANITVTPPTNYVVSTSQNGPYTSSVTLTQTSGSVSSTNVYVRLQEGLAVNASYTGNVTIASTGATSKTVDLSGSVTGYTVTYDCNGGTIGCPATPVNNVPSGSYTLASAPTRTNYTFNGWSDGTNSYGGGASYTISGDVNFTAQWTPNFPSLSIDPTSFDVEAAGEVIEMTLTAVNIATSSYTVVYYTTSAATVTTTKPSWFGDVVFTGNTLDIEVNENNGIARNAYFKVNTGDVYSEIVTVNQAAITVEDPEFDVEEGTYYEDQLVDITCDTDGATIYYTTDGSTPAANNGTEYDGNGVSIEEGETTLKAIAIKNNVSSSVVSAEYTVVYPLTTMEEIYEAADEAGNTPADVYVTFNNWVVVYTTNNKAYVTDGQYGLVIYGLSHGFTKGKKYSGTTACKVQLYDGGAELTNLTYASSGFSQGDATSVTPYEVSLATICGEDGGKYLGSYVNFGTLTYNGSAFTDGTNTITPYAGITLPTLTSGKTYIVKGVYYIYNSTKQITQYVSGDIAQYTAPSIVPSPLTSLAVPDYIVSTPENDITYETLTVNGTYLQGNITVALEKGASSDFEMLTDLETWGHSITLTQSNGSVTDAEIAVRLKAGKSVADYSDRIVLSSTGATTKYVNVTGSVTYAHVTYNGNGDGVSNVPEDDNDYEYEDEVTVLGEGSMTRTGYEFIAWDTKADGTGTTYEEDDTFDITEDITLYAQWDAATFNLHTASMTNGSVSFTVSNAAATTAKTGQTVTLVVTPSTNYGLASLTVTNETTSETVSVINNTFTMPASDITVSATFKPVVTDVINQSFTGVTGSSYTAWSGKGSNDARYAGQTSAGNSGNIVQIRATSPSGIVTTTSGGKVKKVKVTWNSSTGNNKKLDIYGKNTAYTGSSDLYNSSTYGTKLGSITYSSGTYSGEFEVTGDYAYVGLVSNDGTIYFDEIQVIWAPPTYTVTYNANGGTGTMTDPDSPYTKGQTVTVLSNSFTEPEDKEFSRWNTAANGFGDYYNAGSTFEMPNSNVTLYAQWIDHCSVKATMDSDETSATYTYMPGEDRYKVVFTSEVKTLGGCDITEYGFVYSTSDETPTIGEDNCTKIEVGTSYSTAGVSFNTTIANGTLGATYYVCSYAINNAGTAYSNAKNVAVPSSYPTYTISYSSNGNPDGSSTVNQGNAIGTLPTPSLSYIPDGYEFVGWYNGDSYGSATYPTLVSTATVPTGDMTLKAVFAISPSGERSFEITGGNFTELSTSYADHYHEYTEATIYSNAIKSGTNMQMNKGKGNYVKNTTALPGCISKIVLTWTASGNNSPTMYANTSSVASSGSTSLGTQSDEVTTQTIENLVGYGYKYFYLDGATLGGVCYLSSLKIYYIDYYYTTSATVPSGEYWHVNGSGVLTENSTIPAGNYTFTSPITVPNGKTLTVNGYLGTSSANLIIEEGGQLIIPNNATVAATFIKNVPETAGDKDGTVEVTGWTLISSPTYNVPNDGNPYENFSAVNNLEDASGYLLYKYDEENRMWRSSQTTNHTYNTLNVGQGYLYGNNSGTAIEFTGNVNSAASYSVALSYNTKATDNLAGFNLIGNPYSENISTSNITFVKQDADDITPAGGYVLKNDGTWNTTAATSFEPNSGFLVQINAAGYTAVISKPVHGGKATLANNDYISFTVANSQYEDVTYAWFGKSIPLNKINHRNDEIPMLYIPQNGENYAIAMMDDNTNSFNLNFEAKTTGNYTLRFKANGEFNYLHVIDRLTGEDIDMLVEGEYSFVGSPRDNANRFIVRLGYLPNYSDNGEDIFAYQNGNDIVVSGEGELQIFDVMGHMVSSQRINGVETMCTSSLQNGVYVFRLNEKTQKIVVR